MTDLPTDAALLDALRTVVDPEVGMNIVDLGLIYGIERGTDMLTLRMTLTSPGCPMGPMIVDEVHAALADALPEGSAVEVELVWEPPWTPERMSGRARLTLGWQD
jgi:metal-sulfur cluster biosynthetic enzyme